MVEQIYCHTKYRSTVATSRKQRLSLQQYEDYAL